MTMSNPGYLLPRLGRHFLPAEIVNSLLDRRFIIKPGLETSSPELAVQRYINVLNQHSIPYVGKQIMIFGYGGNLTIGCLLLQAGAQKVFLCEREGFRKVTIPESLVVRFPEFFRKVQGKNIPFPELISIYHQDLSNLVINQKIKKSDLILSSSVFEHLSQPEQVTATLVQLTASNGVHLHFIDLRDHFFKYPFEMLCYTDKTWKNWLNPTSNLNRMRISDYRQMFEKFFDHVTIDAIETNGAAFSRIKTRILPQFKSGDDNLDCVTQISLIARKPK